MVSLSSSHVSQISKLFYILIERRLNLIMCRKTIKYRLLIPKDAEVLRCLTSVGVFQEGLTSDGHRIPSAAMTT